MTNTRHRSLLLWLAEWIVLSALWFMLEGTVSWIEAIAGCTTAALITIITAKLINQNFAAFWPRLQWLGLVWRLPLEVLRDSAIVLVALGQRLQGQAVSGAFKRLSLPDAGANSRAAARRAIVTTLVSLPPNSIVVGIDPATNTLLIHEILPQSQLPAIAKQLGAEEIS